MEKYQCIASSCAQAPSYFCPCQKPAVFVCDTHLHQHTESSRDHSTVQIWHILNSSEHELTLQAYKHLEQAAQALVDEYNGQEEEQVRVIEEGLSIATQLSSILATGWNNFEQGKPLFADLKPSEWVAELLKQPQLKTKFIHEQKKHCVLELCSTADRLKQVGSSNEALQLYREALQVQHELGESITSILVQFTKTLEDDGKHDEALQTFFEQVSLSDSNDKDLSSLKTTLHILRQYSVQLSDIITNLVITDGQAGRSQIYDKIIKAFQNQGIQRECEATARKLDEADSEALHTQYTLYTMLFAFNALDDGPINLESPCFSVLTPPQLVQVSRGCPIYCEPTGDGTKFFFLHSSIKDYVIARTLIRELDQAVVGALAPTTTLNTYNISQKPDICHFFLQMASTDYKRYEFLLFDITRQSKTHPNLGIASANAISILNRMEFSFALKNLKSVKISGANLLGASLKGTRLKQADLHSSCLVSCDLNNAQLKNANLINVELGRTLPLTVDSSKIVSICFSPNGTLVATSADARASIWDATSYQHIRTLKGGPNRENAASLSHCGEFIVSGYKEVIIRRLDTYQTVCTMAMHTEIVLAVAFSNDSQFIASGGWDKSVIVWKVATGQPVAILRGHSSIVSALSFSTCGKRVASGSWDMTVIVWDRTTNDRVFTLCGHSSRVSSICYSPDGTLIASGSWDMTVVLWAVASQSKIYTLKGHESRVTAVAFSRDGAFIASGSRDRSVIVWDISSGMQISRLRGHSGTINAICFSLDGTQVASGGCDSRVIVQKTIPEEQPEYLRGHSRSVVTGCISPDCSIIVSGSIDMTLIVWDVATGRKIRSLQGHLSRVTAVAVSSDSKFIGSASRDAKVLLWEISTGDLLRVLEEHSHPVAAVGFSPDGRLLVSGGDNKALMIWLVATGECMLKIIGHSFAVKSVCFSPNSAFLASGSRDRTVKVWEVATGKLLKTLVGHSREVTTLCFSRNGAFIVSGSADKSIILWSAETGKLLSTFQGHTHHVVALDYLSTAGFILSGSLDGYIIIWDTTSGQQVRSFRGCTKKIHAVRFSSNETLVAAGSSEESIIVFRESFPNPSEQVPTQSSIITNRT